MSDLEARIAIVEQALSELSQERDRPDPFRAENRRDFMMPKELLDLQAEFAQLRLQQEQNKDEFLEMLLKGGATDDEYKKVYEPFPVIQSGPNSVRVFDSTRTRNGIPLTLSTLDTDKTYATLTGISVVSTVYYIYLELSQSLNAVHPGVRPDRCTAKVALANNPVFTSDNYDNKAGNTVHIIAKVTTGTTGKISKVEPWSNWDDWVMLPDSWWPVPPAAAPQKSLEVCPNNTYFAEFMLQIFGFDSGTPAAAIDLNYLETAEEMFILRGPFSAGSPTVQYLSMSGFLDIVYGPDFPSHDDIVDNHSGPYPGDPDYDPDNPDANWDAHDAQYWRLGGTFANCYGQTIGAGTTEPAYAVIDLINRYLRTDIADLDNGEPADATLKWSQCSCIRHVLNHLNKLVPLTSINWSAGTLASAKGVGTGSPSPETALNWLTYGDLRMYMNGGTITMYDDTGISAAQRFTFSIGTSGPASVSVLTGYEVMRIAGGLQLELMCNDLANANMTITQNDEVKITTAGGFQMNTKTGLTYRTEKLRLPTEGGGYVEGYMQNGVFTVD